MAKLTYLQLTNKVLKRCDKAELSAISGATSGINKIVTELINEAQLFLFTEANWHSLYTTRTFSTVADTANYSLASDWGRTILMADTTNNTIMTEEGMRGFDEDDPDADYTGQPRWFAILGAEYRLYPTPAGAYTIRERYWKVPTTLSSDSDTSDLPIEVENCIIHWTLIETLEYLRKYEDADRKRKALFGSILEKIPGLLPRAISSNQKVIDRMFRFKRVVSDGYGINPVRLPTGYPRMY